MDDIQVIVDDVNNAQPQPTEAPNLIQARGTYLLALTWMRNERDGNANNY